MDATNVNTNQLNDYTTAVPPIGQADQPLSHADDANDANKEDLYGKNKSAGFLDFIGWDYLSPNKKYVAKMAGLLIVAILCFVGVVYIKDEDASGSGIMFRVVLGMIGGVCTLVAGYTAYKFIKNRKNSYKIV